MTDLTKLKLLLEIPPERTEEDSLLTVLLLEADAYARSYCRLGDGEDSGILRDTVCRMAAEDYGRRGSDGVEKRTYSGVSETYGSGYSKRVTAMLHRLRRLETVGGGGLPC